jgi:ankyrin repeat protein
MLLQASTIDHEGIVHILMERSMDVNLADRNAWTAMIWALKEGHDSVLKLLLQTDGIDINTKSDIDLTALS